jgi:hypothetical protein
MRHFASRAFWETDEKLPKQVHALADKNYALLIFHNCRRRPTPRVTTGLDPVVHADSSLARPYRMDCRVKPGNDDKSSGPQCGDFPLDIRPSFGYKTAISLTERTPAGNSG